MKRIIRLTESDLTRIVRRVINEGVDAHTISSDIVKLFNTPSFWAPYKGTITTLGNDREGQAIVAFTEWWTKNIQPKVNLLPKDQQNQFLTIKMMIGTKLEGNTGSDTYTWTIAGTRYTVDTDF